MPHKKVIVIGIAGPAASGKSLLANSLLSNVSQEQVVVINADNYYKDHSKLSVEEKN
ncbi:MAG: hypothetical protein AB8V23_04975 [Candidatus Midichloria sp.]|uniref:Uridine kinase n=1 Tax=Hyalomma marginatum TaxID=34627 RepID=A0A8S4C3C4_9ACAR|nr:uridine kinase [Hyalomma marginatum]CAG7598499.1 uridine kinase [Hyalomma marginatum]